MPVMCVHSPPSLRSAFPPPYKQLVTSLYDYRHDPHAVGLLDTLGEDAPVVYVGDTDNAISHTDFE